MLWGLGIQGMKKGNIGEILMMILPARDLSK